MTRANFERFPGGTVEVEFKHKGTTYNVKLDLVINHHEPAYMRPLCYEVEVDHEILADRLFAEAEVRPRKKQKEEVVSALRESVPKYLRLL